MLQFTGERFIPTKELINDEIGFEHLHRYHSVIPFVQNKTVLDIACGEGYGTALIGKYAKKVYGVDIDESCVKWAQEHYAALNKKLEFKKGSVDLIPVADNTVDVIISFETIEHVDDAVQHAFMAEVKRVLKPDGILVISTPNTANYSDRYEHNNEFHQKEFEKEEFHDFLKGHFNYTYHFEQGYEIVSTISSNDITTIKDLSVYNWERDLKKVNRKYLISLASNTEIAGSDRLSSIVLQVDKDYLGLIDYIYSLQRQETHQEQVIQQLRQTLEQQEQKNNELSSALTDKENIISDQNSRLVAVQQQFDQVNGRLSEIFSSDGWKLLSVYYRFKDKVIPEGSNRQKKLKKLFNKIRNKKSHNFPVPEFAPPPKYQLEELTTFDIIEFPVFDQPKVSIVIPAFDGWQMNYQCLRSIFRNTHGVSYEVIFADDGSSDETANIKNYIKNIVVIRNKTNLGFLQNCNHAATFAKGEYIHFLNNDTLVTSGWLVSLSELMDKDPQIGMAGSKLIYPDGRLQEAGGILWQDASAWNYGHKQDAESPEFNYVKEVDYISGASIMIRKSAWRKIGGFNEMFSPAYCEDSDFAFEVRKAGLKVIYQPLSTVVHFEGFSHGTDNNPQGGLTQIKAYQKINGEKFNNKWKDELKLHFPNGVDPFWARDRSQSKKTILVIDHYVPQFDKDAGSRTTFQYLRLWTELGMNVKFIGDNFYKQEPYTTVLQQLGVEVLYGSYYAENWQKWIIDNEKYFDYILLNRPHITSKYIDFLKNNTKTKIYYYGHDLHFYRELKEYEITQDKTTLKSSNDWKKIEYDIFEKSDVILTPTLKEKNIIHADFADKKIEVMPAFFYPEISSPVSNFDERANLMFVGGFTHGPNADAVLWFIEKVFPVVQDRIPAIKLIVVGSNTPEKILQKASPNIVIKGYVSDTELDQLYKNVKIAVIPLRYGAGLKGKTVEAMVNGVPFVSTSFGLEGLNDTEEWLQPHDNESDFANAIVKLYNDPEALRQMSARMVEYSKVNFTNESATIFFRKLFNF